MARPWARARFGRSGAGQIEAPRRRVRAGRRPEVCSSDVCLRPGPGRQPRAPFSLLPRAVHRNCHGSDVSASACVPAVAAFREKALERRLLQRCWGIPTPSAGSRSRTRARRLSCAECVPSFWRLRGCPSLARLPVRATRARSKRQARSMAAQDPLEPRSLSRLARRALAQRARRPLRALATSAVRAHGARRRVRASSSSPIQTLAANRGPRAPARGGTRAPPLQPEALVHLAPTRLIRCPREPLRKRSARA
jgi:hypothetical protein